MVPRLAARAVASLPEIVSLVVDGLEGSENTPTLRSLCLTSPNFYDAASRTLYHRFRCSDSDTRGLELFLGTLQARPSLGHHVHQIDYAEKARSPKSTTCLIFSILAFTPNLRAIHLDGLCESTMFKVLQRLKRCRELETFECVGPDRGSIIFFSTLRECLASCPRLKRFVCTQSLCIPPHWPSQPRNAFRLEEVDIRVAGLAKADLDLFLGSSRRSLRDISLTLLSSPSIATTALVHSLAEFKSVERLELVVGGRHPQRYEGLVDTLVASWPRLKYLSLTGDVFTSTVCRFPELFRTQRRSLTL
jgi:hypothetical protein